MKLSTTTRAMVGTVAVAGTLALSACGGASNETASSGSSSSGGSSASSAPKLNGTLSGAGSSAQQAAMQGWTAGFNQQQPGVTVNYDPVGSGGGVTQFLAGGIDFAGSDKALTDDQVTQATTLCGSAGYFELPDYISAIAVVYNLPGVSDLQLDADTLAKIFAGQITKWNDPAIAALNQGKNLPGTTITAVHRADKSGTTNNFTDYLHQASPSVWTNAANETWPLQGGASANQTSGMVQSVTSGNGAIGYADLSQAGNLGIAKIKVGSTYVKADSAAAAKDVAASPTVSGRNANDLALNINRTTTDSSQYPIVLASYHIGCITPKAAGKGPLLKGFLSYVISSEGQQAAAKAAGSAPISDSQRAKSQSIVAKIGG